MEHNLYVSKFDLKMFWHLLETEILAVAELKFHLEEGKGRMEIPEGFFQV